MPDITLSASARTNLLSLQGTASMIGRGQNRLSTGLAVGSPLDDAVKFFQAKSLTSRAQDLGERKDSVDQGVSALTATLKATDGIENLIQRMKGIVDSARSQTQAERKEAQKQLGELVRQVDKLVNDATYKGLNLINSSAAKLTVRFSDKSDSKLDVQGIDLNASMALYRDTDGLTDGITLDLGAVNNGDASDASDIGLAAANAFGLCGLTEYSFSDADELASFQAAADVAIIRLEKTVNNLRAKAATLAANADILKVRLDFTKEYVNTLKEGSDKLTLADLNEEGANLLALQTRQQLGIQALAFAGQSEQSVLSLFR